MNIALKANIYHKDAKVRVNHCLDYLLGKGVNLWVDRDLTELIRGRSLPLIDESSFPDEISLVLALGGDGTVLGAARLAGTSQVPIYAVNLGNFGFLTTSSLEEFPRDFERILDGDYQVEERMMLKAEVVCRDGTKATCSALNDIVLHKGALARPIMIDLKAGDDLVGVFPCDGIIISTPTGSTAYSLSAAGPILFPLMNAIAVTPVCPHTLAVRPLVVPADIPIFLREQSSHEDVVLTVDGQIRQDVHEDDLVKVTKASHVTRLVKPFKGSFFFRLRSKLKWGERERE